MKRHDDLEGKVAVITGGVGQLGKQYTKALIANGVKVAAIDIKPAPEGFGDDNEMCKYYLVDITKKAEIELAAEVIEMELGTPNILINNAAIDSPPGAPGKDTCRFEDYPEQSLDETYAVNVKGTFLCCQVFGGFMAKHGSGSIINISSIYAIVSPDMKIYPEGFYKPIGYTVTKAAVLGLTRRLATELASKNVRVNALILGGVFNNQDPAFVKKYCEKVPMGRMANIDDYDGLVLFLASDASKYITGTGIIADGGYTAW